MLRAGIRGEQTDHLLCARQQLRRVPGLVQGPVVMHAAWRSTALFLASRVAAATNAAAAAARTAASWGSAAHAILPAQAAPPASSIATTSTNVTVTLA